MDVEFIAEVSSNHNQDLDRCLRFIETAKQIGCDGIKFQLFKMDELFAPQIIKYNPQLNKRRAWELSLKFIPKLAKASHKLGLKFSCTPFYLEAVEDLRPYVDFYKIASYELLWHDILRMCAKTDIPIVLSTGMANIEEIDAAVEAMRSGGARDITLLHCISSYPVTVSQCNLAAIKTLRDRYGCKSGWSGHIVSDAVIYRAVFKWQASMVEFHMDLDGNGDEFNKDYCWLPEKMAAVISNLRQGAGAELSDESADSDGVKNPVESELDERNWRADPSDGLRPLLKLRESWRSE